MTCLPMNELTLRAVAESEQRQRQLLSLLDRFPYLYPRHVMELLPDLEGLKWDSRRKAVYKTLKALRNKELIESVGRKIGGRGSTPGAYRLTRHPARGGRRSVYARGPADQR